jgi:transposase
MPNRRKPYPSDVSDDEWSLVVPYLTLMREDAGQREHSLRELFNGLRYLVRYGIAWRAIPNDLPPWFAVHQQAQRCLAGGCFETLAHDLRAVLRFAAGRTEEPSAAIIDSRTLRSTPESGSRAGYDGAKRKRGSKLHLAADRLGHLLALHVTPANVDDRAQVDRLADSIQEATGESVSPDTTSPPRPACSRSLRMTNQQLRTGGYLANRNVSVTSATHAEEWFGRTGL